ncbi:hypothetical protein [Aridibaculum aurantiacum]|uniref:hypothetical protein n=1 Tax=Aridibaculum aurantiacum TaxID=2810307 RepID=UPI001A96E1BE|nr:hypothetical protein [Aridibaculum aurantiacum]
MSADRYKQLLKQLIDSTDNEILLKHWKRQMEWDIQHQHEVELTEEEWNLVSEGISDYEKGDIISLKEFIEKNK